MPRRCYALNMDYTQLPQSSAPHTVTDPNMQNKPKLPWIIKIILIILVVLTLGGLGWYIWQRQRPEPATVTTDTFKKTGYDDACALVSKATVERAFNSKFEEFTKDDTTRAGLNKDNSSCTINEKHEQTAKGALEFISLQIAVDNFNSEDTAKSKLDVMRRSVVIDGKLLDITTEVQGVGNEAFFSKNQVSGSTQEYLFVRKDARLFHFIAVKFNGIDSEKVRPQLIEVAKKAIE